MIPGSAFIFFVIWRFSTCWRASFSVLLFIQAPIAGLCIVCRLEAANKGPLLILFSLQAISHFRRSPFYPGQLSSPL
jgi:hypothetical protein